MNGPIEHQDSSGHMPIGVSLDGALCEVAPQDDLHGRATLDAVAARLGVSPLRFEALLLCRSHPGTAAVDCTVCVPVEG